MKKYEVILILDDRKSDESSNIADNVKNQVCTLGGEVLETQEMGHRQLAHPIKKRSTGIYWNIIAMLPPRKVVDLKECFRLNDDFLRMDVFCYEQPDTPAAKPTAESTPDAETTENVADDSEAAIPVSDDSKSAKTEDTTES